MTTRPLAPATCVLRRFSMRQPSTASKRNHLYRNLKARIISTELQYHVRLKHSVISLFVTARAYIVRCIALFFSRDAASHSRRVFRLSMPDCLIILVDQCADYEGLPAMGHLKNIYIPFLATRVLYSEATLFREHSRSCRTEHSTALE